MEGHHGTFSGQRRPFGAITGCHVVRERFVADTSEFPVSHGGTTTQIRGALVRNGLSEADKGNGIPLIFESFQ